MVISNAGTVVAAISAVNECVTFFQWVKSLWSHRNRTENQEEGDVPKLQSSLGAHLSGTEKQELREDDVLKLQSSLYTLSGMYSFTDQAQVLPELKAAVCDMQDLLEDFRCYQQKKAKIEGSATSVEPGTKFFHDFIQGSFSKLIDIQQRLHNQYRLLEEMSLHQATPWFNRSVRPETTSFPTEAKIFGRDDEIKELIRMLGVPGPSVNETDPTGAAPSVEFRRMERTRIMEEYSSGVQPVPAPTSIQTAKKRVQPGRVGPVPPTKHTVRLKRKRSATITSVPVLPIVGIGGVGKTTLAQIVCHHPQVRKHFDVIVWLCVSLDFDVKRLTKEAIEKFSGEAVTKDDNVDSLQVDLAQSINKRRFLVVLDDVWSESDDLWKRFYVPFKHVLQGSMMLVTTRSPTVAYKVGTVDPFLLVESKNNILHEFFKQCAFGSDSSNNDPVLEWIGKQIVSKLKGSPLLAKICGRLLGMCLDPAFWNMILTSQLWELTDSTPIVRLSYINLPHHLKSCFLFCATYPKNYSFVKEDLAEIWVAQGFVPLKETGCKYFEELAHRSFFQKLHGKFVMYDLVHDMAQLALNEECFIIKEEKDLERPQTDVPAMREPQHSASTSASTQAPTCHTDIPPMWPPPMSRRQRGQIDSDSSIHKVLKIVLRMNKDMSNALHREKQARKRDSERIKRGLRQINKLRTAGKAVSPSESEAEELEVESEDEKYPDFDALISQVLSEQQCDQSYAPGGGYGYGFGAQFHPGASSSSALQQHQQYGQSYAPGGGYGFPYGFGGQFHPGASSSSALLQHQQYGQSYAPGGGYGYGFGGQFHPGASSSTLQQPPSQCQ